MLKPFWLLRRLKRVVVCFGAEPPRSHHRSPRPLAQRFVRCSVCHIMSTTTMTMTRGIDGIVSHAPSSSSSSIVALLRTPAVATFMAHYSEIPLVSSPRRWCRWGWDSQPRGGDRPTTWSGSDWMARAPKLQLNFVSKDGPSASQNQSRILKSVLYQSILRFAASSQSPLRRQSGPRPRPRPRHRCR